MAATNTLKRKHSSEDVDMVDMEMDIGAQANGNGATPGVDDVHDAIRLRRPNATTALFHTDPRPDDFAHAGLRRGMALALAHVGFDAADPAAIESFALAAEECMS